MKAWAVLAGKHAAVVSATGLGVSPAVGSAALDSFALGALAAGTCVAVLSPGWRGTARPLRPARPSRRLSLTDGGLWPADAAGRAVSAFRGGLTFRGRVGKLQADLPAAHSGENAAPGQNAAPGGKAAPGAGKPEEAFWGPYSRKDAGQGNGYQSRHRLTDPSQAPRRPESRRTMPRHAAPPASFGQRMTGRSAARALASDWHH